jgi:hypothetical protein
MRLLAAAALTVAAAAGTGAGTGAGTVGAQSEARWGPVAEGLGTGSGICLDGENIVCAVVLCEEGALTLGVLGTGHSGEQPVFRSRIDVDGQIFEREMESRGVMEGFLHVRTPIRPGEPLWRGLRAGSKLALSSAADAEPLGYSLAGSAVELDRVAAACR